MNILVIGNGFDLAHGLPTRYTDFLEFVKAIKQALSKGKLAGIEWGNTDEKVKNFLKSNRWKVQENLFLGKQTWEDLINNNIWIDYFLQKGKHDKENWIDFEIEISNIIRSLDNDMKSNDESLDDSVCQCSNFFLNNKFCSFLDEMKPNMSTYRMIRNELLYNLNKLIRALEIYLTEYVDKIEIQKKSPDIDLLEIDHVLSFNYTDTYEKIYGNGKEIEYDYIHGKADSGSTIDSNNMVLGIDEYLPEDRRNKDVEFIAFKKFYQRIHKGTGCKYKEWADNIYNNYMKYLNYQKKLSEQSINGVCTIKSFRFSDMKSGEQVIVSNPSKYEKHNLYIFGHSLDVTDRDILRDLILNDNVYTTIFYVNKDVMGQQIANLVKVIGQDELIRRTGGSTKTIEFKQQQDMVEIKS